MPKTVYLYYQDCAMCGSKEKWGAEQIKIATKAKVNIEKVPFYKDGAKEIIWDAVRAGMSLPFFTDKEGHFAKNLDELLEATTERKPNKKKEVSNGTI